MSQFRNFVDGVLADRVIGDSEVEQIRQLIHVDGRLDLDDVKLLVELYCEAREYPRAFEDLFFAVLEEVMLADGEIQPSEQFYLLKMLYSDREVRPRERDFLKRLRARLKRGSPEFETLYETAMQANGAEWSVGGR